MHYLKPYFIHVFFVFTLVSFLISAYSLLNIVNTGSLGILIATGSILFFFIRNHLAKDIHLKRFDNIVIYALFFSSAVIFIGAFFSQTDQSSYMFSSILLFVFWFFYELWYCQYPAFKNIQIKLGAQFSPLGLIDIQGNHFSINQAKHCSIFIFYNGNWNQFCRSQLQELKQYQQTIKQHNTRIFVISSQSPDKMMQLEGSIGLEATYLIDKNNQLAQQLGLIQHKSYPILIKLLNFTTPICIPAVIVTDIDDTIIYSHLSGSLRTRAACKELLEKVEQMKVNDYANKQTTVLMD